MTHCILAYSCVPPVTSLSFLDEINISLPLSPQIQMVLNRLVNMPAGKAFLTSPVASRVMTRLASSNAKKGGFNKMSLVNYLGLPVLGFIYFYILPIADTNEMHNSEWHAERLRAHQKKLREEREARLAAAGISSSS